MHATTHPRGGKKEEELSIGEQKKGREESHPLMLDGRRSFEFDRAEVLG